MSTATVSKRRPIKMIKGSGENAFTLYNCKAVEEAFDNDQKLLVVRTRKGVASEVEIKPHIVHKRSLRDVYGDTHPNAGKGKYIDLSAYTDKHHQNIVGAHLVHPYLPKDGCYFAIVNTLQGMVSDKKQLRDLSGEIHFSAEKGEHIVWEGERNDDGFLVASPWMTEKELWAACVNAVPSLASKLRKGNFSPRQKFRSALQVLNRAVEVVDIVTGNVENRGGVTPYSKPLEQCGFAIDRRYLTNGYSTSTGDSAEYYYRLVVGRSEPHNLMRSQWWYLTKDNPQAFVSAQAQREYNKALRSR